jgi:capsular polysaccharide transport system permease protein
MSPAPAASASELRRGLITQGRVIHALLLREVITRFGRHNIGVLWLFGEPMMFTVGVATLWSAGGFAHHSGVPIVPFAVTAYSTVLMWRNTIGRCSVAVLQNLNLLYHRNVQVIDILLTRCILECVGTIASFTILTTALVVSGWMPMPEDLLRVAGGLSLLAWFSTALGLLVGAMASLNELIDRIWHPVAYVLMPLSGAAFMVDWLPQRIRDFVLLLPIVHCVELLRSGYFGHIVTTYYSIPYVLAFNLGLTFVGLLVVRYASSRVEEL